MATLDREDLVPLLADVVYGQGPVEPTSVHVRERSGQPGFDGTARVRNLVLEINSPRGRHPLLLTVITPSHADDVPMFVGLNFRGNHTIDADASLSLSPEGTGRLHYDRFTTDPQPRGARASRWQVPMLLANGFGLATACYLQLGPDSPDLRTTGVFPLLQGSDTATWGGIGMWAWALQRLLDVLREESLGSAHIAFGHSRLGKTALWAAVQDPRFAGVIANDSGCLGASMSTAAGAETPGLLARVRPYWFCEGFAARVREQNPWPGADVLLAAINPRPVYVASAADDLPADPAGEREAVERARRRAPHGRFGYHVREGPHDVTATDWEHFLDYFARELPATPPRPSPATHAHRPGEGGPMP